MAASSVSMTRIVRLSDCRTTQRGANTEDKLLTQQLLELTF
jgi:hypothetical protein